MFTKMLVFVIYIVLCVFVVNAKEQGQRVPLPEKFFIGAGSSAYQVEGGWNQDGKGESIWDTFVHQHPELIIDQSTGDTAADSYHQFEEDIKTLKLLHLNAYRFSISWSRILPKGDLSVINQAGIRYYDHLIDRLTEENIEPIVTMFHWDLPESLQTQFGGWSNRVVVDYFVDYASLLFSKFGNRVKWWVTINEPFMFCQGYGSLGTPFPPLVDSPGKADYLCGHNLLLAHGNVYRLYDKEFRAQQNGKLGLALNLLWPEPKTQNPDDLQAAQDQISFQYEIYTNPILSQEGDYPTVVRERVLRNSLEQGLRRSRLPQFTASEIEMLKGSADFLGLNYYLSVVASSGKDGVKYSKDWDTEAQLGTDPEWDTSISPFMPYNPNGLFKVLLYIHEKYPEIDILITENGFADQGEIEDMGRVQSLLEHLREALKAKHDHGVPLIGYMHWSLIDGFEWERGYKFTFGLCQVNFTDSKRTRKIKNSGWIYQDIAKQWSVPAFSEVRFDDAYCESDQC